MIVALALSLAGQPSSPSAGIDPPTARATFEIAVRNYVKFVTPHCAPEEVYPYISFNEQRDRVFRRSLKDTALDEAYREAVRQQSAEDKTTVYECAGPPPPPPPPGTVAPAINPRALAIAEAQKRLRDIAQDLPALFDRADALFAAMVAARDQATGMRH